LGSEERMLAIIGEKAPPPSAEMQAGAGLYNERKKNTTEEEKGKLSALQGGKRADVSQKGWSIAHKPYEGGNTKDALRKKDGSTFDPKRKERFSGFVPMRAAKTRRSNGEETVPCLPSPAVCID